MTESNVVPIRPDSDEAELAISRPGEDVEVWDLMGGVAHIADQVADGPLPEGFDALAKELLQVRIIRSRFSDYERRLEKAMDECRPNQITRVEGVGTIERRPGSTNEKWEDAAVALALLKQTREENVDFSTGEMQMPSDEALLNAFLTCASISRWRVTELKGRGIDPNEFRTKEPGRVKFTIADAPK